MPAAARRIATLTAAGLVVAVLAGCSSAAERAPDPFRDDLVAQVSGTGALRHVEALQRIADENGGVRDTPGPGYDAGVEYVAGVLRDAGYDVATPTYVPEDREGAGPASFRNVVAQTWTGSAERVVLVGAHLDSVSEGPGMNDNASGTAALLEIATRLGGAPDVANSVRFAFWGSEEDELDGSTQYVESLTDPERDRVALYLNVDMIASPNGGYYVQGGKGFRESDAGPDGSEAVGRMLVDELAAVGAEAELVEFDGSSDYDAFVEAGIPSGGVLAGGEDEKTAAEAERWGGTAGAVQDPCYHSACDRLDNVDPERLDRFTDALAGTVAHFARSTAGTPRG